MSERQPKFSFTPRLFTIDAAAHYLGVSRATIKEWLAEGKLEPVRLPGIRGRQFLEKTLFDRHQLNLVVREGR